MRPTALRRVDWYDLPRYYDLVFAAGTEAEANFLVAAAARFGRVDPALARRALEPACGSGRLIRALGRRGWTAAGFDANPRMLAYARRQGGAAAGIGPLWADRMEAFVTPPGEGPYALAHCLVDSFRYLADEATAKACLLAIARALAPGGIFVLGLHLCHYAHARPTRELWRAEEGRLEVVCDVQSAAPCPRRRQEATRARLAVRHSRRQLWQLSETHWNFRTYSAGELTALLAQIPTLEHLATFGFAYDLERPQPLEGRRRDAVLVLRRRAAAS